MTAEKHTMFWKQIFVFNKRAFIVSALTIILCLMLLVFCSVTLYLKVFILLVIFGTLYLSAVSLIASYFIYDRSALYKYSWLKPFVNNHTVIFNLYSGYSEGGRLLEKNISAGEINHLDFFDQASAVTGSIRIAQKLSQPLHSTPISFSKWQINQRADLILFMQSLHELRSMQQKVDCLLSAKQHLHATGQIIIVEHLCDIKNFLIYGPGAFHFYGERHWRKAVAEAGLKIAQTFNITPFIKTFILQTHA